MTTLPYNYFYNKLYDYIIIQSLIVVDMLFFIVFLSFQVIKVHTHGGTKE